VAARGRVLCSFGGDGRDYGVELYGEEERDIRNRRLLQGLRRMLRVWQRFVGMKRCL
jgi:hypothetical protein